MPEAPYRRESAQPVPEYPATAFGWKWLKRFLRSKWGIALLVLLGLIGVQVAWWLILGSGVPVELVNQTDNPLNEVVVRADSWENFRGRIEPGGRTRMRVNLRRDVPLNVPLRVTYQDPSGKPQTFIFESFEPKFLQAEGRKFVVVLTDDGFYRYSEDDGGWYNHLRREAYRWLWMFR